MCDRRLLLSLPSSAPSLRCGCLPIHWDTGFHPSTSEVSDSGGQEVRGLCLLWSLGTQTPSILSLCSLLVVFACMFKHWMLEVSVPVGGSQKEGWCPGQATRQKLHLLLVFLFHRREQSLSSVPGCREAGLWDFSAGSVCLRREAGHFGGD